MKKALAVTILLLAPVLVAQWVSLRKVSEIRAWMAGRAPQEILVGVDWPFAANRDGMGEGLLLAQEEINARGVHGKRIELLLRDDRMDRDESRNIAINFARNPRMVAAIGYYDDQFAASASMILEEGRMLHIVTGAKSAYMTSHGFRYLVHAVLSSDRVGRALARMCMERGYHNYALVSEEGSSGEDLAYQFGTELDALDAHVVYQSSYVRGTVDFRDTVNELKGVEADVIFFAGLTHESAMFIKTGRSMRLKTPVVGTFSDTHEMRALAGSALEGVMFYDIYDVNSPTPENRDFVARYRRRFGRDPETYAAQGYDALQILAKAIETTGSANSLDLVYAIRDMDRWTGANGSYKFDSNGELEDKDVFLKVYREGKPVVLETSRAGASRSLLQ